MIYETDWHDYSLLDASDGHRLERWSKYILVRPDPQVIWTSEKRHPFWNYVHAVYKRTSKGGGSWEFLKPLPENWIIGYEPLKLKFKIIPMGFKHTGLFPEQAANWVWMHDIIKTNKIRRNGKTVSILNLFAYTGGATLACASAGAEVCHVDASKGMIFHAKENAALSNLENAPIRYITDDCVKFVEREIRRGCVYDGIILDPPSYGRGASGETWKIEDDLFNLLKLLMKLLSPEPLFILINQYTAGLAPSSAGYMLDMLTRPFGGIVVSDEIGLAVESTGSALPCGSFSRWNARQ